MSLPINHLSTLFNITGSLTEAIIAQHSSLRGIARQLAEVYYIVGAQQLDGYGQECFLAKGQLILKCIFGIFNFHKKRTKTIRLEVQ